MDKPTKGHFRLAGREFPEVTWYKESGMRKTYLILLFVVLTSATNGYDGSMTNGLFALPPFTNYFHNPSGSLYGLFSCIMFLGSLIAVPVIPYVADGLGRRMGIFIGCTIMIFAVIIQSCSVNFRMFVAARFFLGFGVAIAHGAAPLLITELVHPQHRAIYTTIYNTTWYLGSIIAAWLTYGTDKMDSNWAWRIPSIVQALPSLIQISFVWFVPESPRWLISKGRPEKALSILAKVHANGDVDDEVVQLEYQEIKDTIKLEKEFEGNAWSELWKTKGNRHRLIILLSAGLFSQWSGNGLVSYYIKGVLEGIGYTDSSTILIVNGCLQVLNLLVAVGFCFVVDKVGRRKLFLISTTGMMLCFVFWTMCSALFDKTQKKSYGSGVVALIYIYYCFYNTAWSGLLVGYCVEILPYNIRAKGMCVLWVAIDIALFINVYVNPVALNHIHWRYYIVYCCWLAFELAVVWKFYIETRNTPLEEIARHFDGDQAIIGGAAATEKSRHLAEELHLEEKENAAVEHKEF